MTDPTPLTIPSEQFRELVQDVFRVSIRDSIKADFSPGPNLSWTVPGRKMVQRRSSLP